MRIARKLVANWMFFATIVVLICWLAALPNTAAAQNNQVGWNAVCPGTTGTTCGTPTPSSSFIDATRFNGDICGQIYNALVSVPSSVPAFFHPVIDARGTKASLTCTGSETPWVPTSGTAYTNPSTILLPAGTITISASWVLPSNTKLIGVGAEYTNPQGVPETSIAETPSGFAGPALLQMCDATTNQRCFGVGISNLSLIGLPRPIFPIDGIDNSNAEEGSFVEHIYMYLISGVGLKLGTHPTGGTSSHSGPYSDIWDEVSGASAQTTACVTIAEGAQPRGIHGITCAADGTPNAAIYLDGQNVSLEDVHVEGFVDGIVVGANGNSTSNVALNVTGASSSANGPVTNVVHICKQSQHNGACTTSSGSVTDLSLQAISTGGSTTPITILDDLTSTTLREPAVGLYVIGEPNGTGGISRFTTSPSTANWGVGSGPPGTGPCTQGSLYSNLANGTLYVCQGTVGATSWFAK
jgi:hypothetical protein